MDKIIFVTLIVLLMVQPGLGKHSAPNFIVINEVKTVGFDNYLDEYVELLNVSDSLFNIGGYSLIYFRTDGLPYGDFQTYFVDGKLYPVLYTFPHPTYIKPYHYFLLASPQYSEAKVPDAIMGENLLSNGQLILVDSTLADTLDAVAWGTIKQPVTNEGLPARYLEPNPGPPVSPELFDSPQWSLQRDPEGNDTNNNLADFSMRRFTTPMNSSDSLKLILNDTFQASCSGEAIVLRWQTLSTTKDLQFFIYQKRLEDSSWNMIDPGPALHTEVQQDTIYYHFACRNMNLNTIYQFKIKEIDFSRKPRFTETITLNYGKSNETEPRPGIFSLAQNYPNPFNSSTIISFEIYDMNPVTLTIYNIKGQIIKTLPQGIKPPGLYKINWDGSDVAGNQVPSGEYFGVLHDGNDFKRLIKMLVLR